MKHAHIVCLALVVTLVTCPAFAQDAPKHLLITQDAVKHAESAEDGPRQVGNASGRTSSPMSHTNRVLTVIALGIAGFFAGAMIGSKLEGNCVCDDPGLKGMVIGAPIGAVVGIVMGAKVR